MVQITPEMTPNPDALKFTLDRPATEGRSVTFREGSDPAASPLAAALFGLGGVLNVFLVSNFVTVTKAPEVSWDELAARVVETIDQHFA